MFKDSSEIAAVFRRFMRAFEDRDVDTIRSLIVQADETLFVGTDAREWLYGVEAYEVVAAQVSEGPEYRWTVHRLDAFEEGSLGWGAADTTVEYANGMVAQPRITAVFRLDAGVWRVLQWHASVPQPNLEMSGVEVTTSLSQLLKSLDTNLESVLRDRFQTNTVTLLFSDIEDSTGRGAELGDAVWSDVIQRHFGEVHRVANAQGGIVVKTMGDGAMLAFESARDGARAALDIQRSVAHQETTEPLRVRIGVHTGDAMHTDSDYFGNTVNKTARIAAAAKGGQVLVSDIVRGLAEHTPGLTFGDPKTLQLKGLPGSHVAYPLLED